jgi:RNA polymerase sigma-70 factor (ECF subfamily)
MGRAQQGERDAYGALLREVSNALATHLRRHVSDRNEIEDVCQETLIAIHRARHT